MDGGAAVDKMGKWSRGAGKNRAERAQGWPITLLLALVLRYGSRRESGEKSESDSSVKAIHTELHPWIRDKGPTMAARGCAVESIDTPCEQHSVLVDSDHGEEDPANYRVSRIYQDLGAHAWGSEACPQVQEGKAVP